MILISVSVKSKWQKKSRRDKLNVNIQMDNATSHKGYTEYDTDIKNKLLELGMSCKFHFQPPHSPDLNALDLGIINS